MYAQDNNSLPVWFILSPAYHHISINSQPFLVGIVSTAPRTPQQNSVVERKIPTLMGRSRAMMIEACFSQQDKRKFWFEVISTSTKLDNIMVRKGRTKPPYTLFHNEEARYKKYLRSFGEMAVIAITDGKKMRSKLDTRGRTGISVGYVDDHAGNVYRFINIQTKKIILSRDVQWLNSFWNNIRKEMVTQ